MIVDFYGDVGKLALSLVLGAVVGIERELNEKPAGLRTNVLICLGSAAFTILSIRLGGKADPARIAAQILSGIGFLGAGAIMREGEHVKGLTTAAVIWVVAAIGMGAGMGYYTLACLTTLGTLAVQIAMTPLDIVVDGLRQRHNFRIISDPDEKAIEVVALILKSHDVRVMHRKVMKRNSLYHSEWLTTGSPASQELVVRDLLQSEKVIEVLY